MEYCYHGSSTHGLKVLKTNPHATHGNYAYATKSKLVSYLFASRCGDDQVYSLFGDGNGMYTMVERIPDAFNYMYSNSASIYTVDGSYFEDKHTGFNEVLSSTDVPVISEEWIQDMGEKINELAEDGLIKLYHYPDRPANIPSDDSDLIAKQIKAASRRNEEVTKYTFMRCCLLHPNLIEMANEYLYSIDQEMIEEDDIVAAYEHFKQRSTENPKGEYYLDYIHDAISEYYLGLLDGRKNN